jgi:hypothetical protein
MRQNDRADLDDMATDIGLTELTKHAILSYPLPDRQKGEKFSASERMRVAGCGIASVTARRTCDGAAAHTV